MRPAVVSQDIKKVCTINTSLFGVRTINICNLISSNLGKINKSVENKI